jgi:hypothetical protein
METLEVDKASWLASECLKPQQTRMATDYQGSGYVVHPNGNISGYMLVTWWLHRSS